MKLLEIEHKLKDIIGIFNRTFEQEYNTKLVKGEKNLFMFLLMIVFHIMLFILQGDFIVVHYMKLHIG